MPFYEDNKKVYDLKEIILVMSESPVSQIVRSSSLRIYDYFMMYLV